jgi:hypothetical protein
MLTDVTAETVIVLTQLNGIRLPDSRPSLLAATLAALLPAARGASRSLPLEAEPSTYQLVTRATKEPA